MIFKRFYINIIIRVLLILATCFLITVSIPSKKLFLIFNHFALLIVQVYFLIRYLNRVNYDLSNFIQALVSKDFNMINFPNYKGKSYSRLYQSLQTITKLLKTSEIESIYQSQYLYAAIQNVGAGLIWFDEKGDILLVNKSVKDIFNIDSLKNINELSAILENLPEILTSIQPNENKLIGIFLNNELKQLSIKATELIQKGKHIKLITVHDIKNELDVAELDSWQKLIRVLAHEIMNSIGPITTTTTAISKYYKDEKGNTVGIDSLNNEIVENTIKGLRIIEERSIGLKTFVGNYRQLSNLPDPVIKEINIKKFIESIGLLMKEDFKNQNISFYVEIENDLLTVLADEKLISQVIINILKNSIESLQNTTNPVIRIKAFRSNENQIKIQLMNNGPEIPEELIDKIFIPFFTTKEEGSGIGLSLSRQIMRLHNGKLSVKSNKQETIFQLTF